MFHLGLAITKVKKNKDGSRTVYGPVTDSALDLDTQIVDPVWAAEKLTEWFKDIEDGGFNATIHQMHSPFLAPAGRGKNLDLKGDTAYIAAKVVEPSAIVLVDEGVYKGFSIGIMDPPIIPDPGAKNGRIGFPGGGGQIGEVSLVDIPANPRCLYSLVKRAKMNAPVQLGGTPSVRSGGEDGELVPLGGKRLTKAFVSALASHDDDAITTALKALRGNGADAIPMATKIGAAAQWYALVKRTMDPNVGGGVDRDKLPDSAFVFPATRDFPIVTPGDVSDAVSTWGLYKGPESFKSFKKKLIALAHRLGKSFVKQLPESWTSAKKGVSQMETANKAARPKGARKCAKCKGAGFLGEEDMKCEKCEGKGWTLPLKDGVKDAEVDTGDGKESIGKGADAAVVAKGAAGEVAPAATKSVDNQVRAARAASRSAVRIARALTKGGDPDSDVDAAIQDLLEGVGDAADAQSEDVEDDPGKPTDTPVTGAIGDVADSIAELAAAQATDEGAGEKKKGKKAKKRAKAVKEDAKPGAHDDDYDDGRDNRDVVDDGSTKAKEPKVKKVKKAKKAKKAKPAFPGAAKPFESKDDDGDKEADAKPEKKKAKKVAKGATSGDGTIAATELRLHDILCPAYTSKAVAKRYPIGDDLPVPDVLDTSYFGAELARLSQQGKKARDGSVGEAWQVFAAANHLSSLEPAKFLSMRDAAAKSFTDAYPDVRVKPHLIDPESFRRPFLASATPEVGHVTRVPLPDLASSLSPAQFQRPPLTVNETRPTLAGGESAVKGASNPNFYGVDGTEAAMSILHDAIATRNPGVCPMDAMEPGTPIDSDGLMGSPAEMLGTRPNVVALPTPGGTASGGTLRPVGKAKTGGSGIGKVAEATSDGILAEVDRRVARLAKSFDRDKRKLQKQLRKRDAELDKALSLPDPTRRAHLGASPRQYAAPVANPEMTLKAQQARDRVKILKSRMSDPNSSVARSAAEELMRTLSPEQFAKVATSDDE